MITFEMALSIVAIIAVLGQYYIERIEKKDKTKKILGLIVATLAIIGIWGSYKIQNNAQKELVYKRDSAAIEQKKRDDDNIKEQKILISKIDTLQTQLNPFLYIASTKFPQLKSDFALAKLANEIESQNKKIAALLNYSDVAELGLNGITNTVSAPLIETTGISELLKPAISIENNRVTAKCDPKSYKIYKEIIDKFPTFPFSYYFLAKCLYSNKNAEWKKYAIKCIDILNHTTMISGHNNNHDDILKELNSIIKN